MNNVRNRKYARSYKKQNNENIDTQYNSERELVISMPCAIGIMAFTFLNGMLLGCLLKRR